MFTNPIMNFVKVALTEKSRAYTRKVVWIKLASEKGNDYIWTAARQLNEPTTQFYL